MEKTGCWTITFTSLDTNYLVFKCLISQLYILFDFQDKLASVPFCKDGTADTGGKGLQVLGVDTGIKFDPGAEIDGYKFDCKAAVGYLAVYRFQSIYNVLCFCTIFTLH